MLRKREAKVLIALMRNGRAADKHIASAYNTSQPTVTRIRQKLEKEGYIQSYMPIVDLRKIGLKMIVVTLFRISTFSKLNYIKKHVLPYLRRLPQVVIIAEGEGMSGKTSMIMSVHKNFEDYQKMILDLREKFDRFVTDIDQFEISTERIYKMSMISPSIDVLQKELQT